MNSTPFAKLFNNLMNHVCKGTVCTCFLTNLTIRDTKEYTKLNRKIELVVIDGKIYQINSNNFIKSTP